MTDLDGFIRLFRNFRLDHEQITVLSGLSRKKKSIVEGNKKITDNLEIPTSVQIFPHVYLGNREAAANWIDFG